MTTISSTFTADGVSSTLALQKTAEDVQYSITGPFDGRVQFERAKTEAEDAWEIIAGPFEDSTVSKSGTLAVGRRAKLRMRAKSLSTGLQTNGTFATDSDWTKGSGWAIAAGVASATTASTALSQTVSIIAGATYLVTFTISNSAAGSVAVSLGGGTAGTSRSTDATFAEVITAGSSDSLLAFTGTGFTGDIDDVTVVPSIAYSFNDTDAVVREYKDADGNLLFYETQAGITFAKPVTMDSTLAVTGAITATGGVAETGVEILQSAPPKAGATAGWTVNAGADTYLATCAAGATAATLVQPITGLEVGDTITSFKVAAQIESGGNTATLDAALYKLTTAAADVTLSSSLGGITQVSVTTDTAVASSKTLTTPEVVAADETYFILITATTAASTDVAYQGATVTVTKA